MENFEVICDELEKLLKQRKEIKEFIAGMSGKRVTFSYDIIHLTSPDSTKKLTLCDTVHKALKDLLLERLTIVEEEIKEYLGV